MHLAFITPFPPSQGTLVEYGAHMARVLAAKPEVSRLSILADQLERPVEEPDHIHRVWRFGSAANALQITQTLRRLRPDAVIFNLQFATFGGQPLPAALGLLSPGLARLQGIPTITLLHNLFETVDLNQAGYAGNPLKERVLRLGGEAFTRLLLGSHLVATTMPTYVEILRQKYRAKNAFLAPHGAFEDPGPPPPLPAAKRVLAFGKFGTYKRLETLLEAHQMVVARDPAAELVVAGTNSPNAPGYLEGLRAVYGEIPGVSYTGYVPEEEVARVFTEAYLVAFPYTATTGSSGVLHQAGQFARPAVMPRIGDLAELVEAEGYQAEFFHPGDAASLAGALDRLLADPERAWQMGLNNYRASVGVLLEDVADWYLLHLERLGRKHAS
ncbi:MAG: glycosyltransferase [Meiothermus sp.]|nr:glycosyltransferase [Meiothermus sp.]